MKRRGVLLLAASAGLATTAATEAFGSSTLGRGLAVTVADDEDAYLGVDLALDCGDPSAAERTGGTAGTDGNETTESSTRSTTATVETESEAGAAGGSSGPVLTVTLTDNFAGSPLEAGTVSVAGVEKAVDLSSTPVEETWVGVSPGDEVTVEARGEGIAVELTRTVPDCAD